MAEYKKTVALEVGAQSVVMAVFTPAGKGYALSRYGRRNILLDPVEEGMRIDYVSHAIGELVKELKLRGQDVRNVVSGQKVFMRLIKLPSLDTVDDMREQVGYEAQQHIPFPPEEIVYDYQLLGSADDGEQEVLLVAIKKDELDELHGQVEANGLRTRSVDCSTTALYNAYRASYDDEGEAVMILDIGAKTTDILFAEGERFFTRSVTAAGSFVTNSIAREFNIGFREAEKLKIEQGLVSLGSGHTESLPEEQANLAGVIRTAMNRLSSEIQRTINHYRAQYKGSVPSKVYICGGGAALPYTAEFLQQTLNVPVEVFNPLQALAIGKRVDMEQLETDAACLGPVVGAAVSGAKAGVFSIDLVPTSVGKERAELRLLPKVAVAGAIALLGAGFFAVTAQKKAEEAQGILRSAAAPIDHLDSLYSSMESNRSKYERGLKELRSYVDLFNLRNAYADLLRQLAEKTSSVSYWFTSVEPLVAYDAVNTSLSVGVDGTDRHLLLDTRGTRAGSMVRAVEAEDSRKAPQVTALLVSGYFYKKSAADQGKQLQRLNELVSTKFDERSADSLFSFQSANVRATGGHYFQVLDAEKSRGNMLIPPYADKFYMVMPLKKPLPVPGNGGTQTAK